MPQLALQLSDTFSTVKFAKLKPLCPSILPHLLPQCFPNPFWGVLQLQRDSPGAQRAEKLESWVLLRHGGLCIYLFHILSFARGKNVLFFRKKKIEQARLLRHFLWWEHMELNVCVCVPAVPGESWLTPGEWLRLTLHLSFCFLNEKKKKALLQPKSI